MTSPVNQARRVAGRSSRRSNSLRKYGILGACPSGQERRAQAWRDHRRRGAVPSMPPRGRDQRCRSGRALSAERSSLGRSRPIEDLVDEFLEIKATEGKSGAHLKDLRLRPRTFASSRDAGQLVAAITTCDIDTWLTGLAVQAQTRMNYRTAVNNFFQARRRARLCAEQPSRGSVEVQGAGKSPRDPESCASPGAPQRSLDERDFPPPSCGHTGRAIARKLGMPELDRLQTIEGQGGAR